jgi:capsular polysaccharide biosynthesis protein
VNGQNGAVVQTLSGLKDAAEPDWPYHDSLLADSQPPGYGAGLVSFSYLKAAVRRSMRFWLALAVIGMVAGAAYKIAVPTPYQATTTILLPQDELSVGVGIASDAALAQSRTVAGLAARKLGLAQSPGSFAKTYTATAPTNDVLVITATARSASDAIRRANAVAAVFLKFRANLEVAEENVTVRSLDNQISQANQQVRALNQQISALPAGPTGGVNTNALADLQAELGQAETTLAAANAGVQSAEQQAALQVKTSNVLDPAAVTPRSAAKPFLLAVAIGLVAGLLLGLGIVIVRALASDRLRQRDDIAAALGSSIELSVGPIRLRSWLPARLGLPNPQNPDIRRVVAHLRATVPADSPAPAALAVVPVDDNPAAAQCVVALAMSYLWEGRRVVLADLTGKRTAARLLGATGAGVSMASEWSERLAVLVPVPADPLPVGPRPGPASTDPAKVASQLVMACAQADVLLVVATLDPASGAEHLATWAADAVVLVTAGRSSGTRIHAVAEMLRLARIQVASAVLIGADHGDDSIGVLAPVPGGWPDEVPLPGPADH